jgi:hypothetical protein
LEEKHKKGVTGLQHMPTLLIFKHAFDQWQTQKKRNEISLPGHVIHLPYFVDEVYNYFTTKIKLRFRQTSKNYALT